MANTTELKSLQLIKVKSGIIALEHLNKKLSKPISRAKTAMLENGFMLDILNNK